MSWCDPYRLGNEFTAPTPPPRHTPPSLQHLIIGGEIPVWTETVAMTNLETITWPRLAAGAERWWSVEGQRDIIDATRRMRATQLAMQEVWGIEGTPLQPEYCYTPDESILAGAPYNCDSVRLSLIFSFGGGGVVPGAAQRPIIPPTHPPTHPLPHPSPTYPPFPPYRDIPTGAPTSCHFSAAQVSNSTPPISLSMVNAVNGAAPTPPPRGNPPPTTTVHISVENNITTFASAFVFYLGTYKAPVCIPPMSIAMTRCIMPMRWRFLLLLGALARRLQSTWRWSSTSTRNCSCTFEGGKSENGCVCVTTVVCIYSFICSRTTNPSIPPPEHSLLSSLHPLP